MDYEQKYKEALGRARDLHDNHALGMPFIYQTCEDIFPELKESEDEKIRKSLIKSFENQHSCNFPTVDGFTREQIIAWLEKQGEQNLVAWSEEDEKLYNSALWHIKNSCGNGGKNSGEYEVYNWLKSLKDRVQPQPKQEWSEYDKIQLIEAIQMIEANGTWIRSKDAVKKVSNWLKSLKPRWKPSKEQLKALHWVAEYGNIIQPELLKSLYNELKKL